MDVRVERHAGLGDALQAQPGEDAVELVGDRRERPLLQVAGRAAGFDVVQHRQQVGEHGLHGKLPHGLAVALDALAVVHVLGLQAQQVLAELGLAVRRGSGVGRGLVEDRLGLGQRVAVVVRLRLPE